MSLAPLDSESISITKCSKTFYANASRLTTFLSVRITVIHLRRSHVTAAHRASGMDNRTNSGVELRWWRKVPERGRREILVYGMFFA